MGIWGCGEEMALNQEGQGEESRCGIQGEGMWRSCYVRVGVDDLVDECQSSLVEGTGQREVQLTG